MCFKAVVCVCVCVGPCPPLAQEAVCGFVEEGLLDCFPLAVAVVMVAETEEGEVPLMLSPCVYSLLCQSLHLESLLPGGK